MECTICLSPLTDQFIEYTCKHTYCVICLLRRLLLQKIKSCCVCSTVSDIHLRSPDNIPYNENIPYKNKNHNKELKKRFGININLFCSSNDLKMIKDLFLHKCIFCSSVFRNKQELFIHYKKKYSLQTCLVCVRSSFLFVFEYPLFLFGDLEKHREGDTCDIYVGLFRPSNISNISNISSISDKDSKNFKKITEQISGHPKCTHCSTQHFDEYTLKDHCNTHHSLCRICLRITRVYKYFLNLSYLKKHCLEKHVLLSCCNFGTDISNTLDVEEMYVENPISLLDHMRKVHGVTKSMSVSNLNQKKGDKKSGEVFVDPFYLINKRKKLLEEEKQKTDTEINKKKLNVEINKKKETKFLSDYLLKPDTENLQRNSINKKLDNLSLVSESIDRRNVQKIDIKIPLSNNKMNNKSNNINNKNKRNEKQLFTEINNEIIKYKNHDLTFKELLSFLMNDLENTEIIVLFDKYRYQFHDLKDDKVFKKVIDDLKFPPFEIKERNSVQIKRGNNSKKEVKTFFKVIDLTKKKK